MPRFSSSRAALVKSDPWQIALAWTPLVVLAAAVVFAVTAMVRQLSVLSPLVITGLFIGLAYALRGSRRRPDLPGKIEVDERGLVHDGRLLVATGDIESGVVLPRGGDDPLVRLHRRGLRLPVDIRVASRDEGRELLRALGLDASQAVASFSLPSRPFSSRERRFRDDPLRGALPALLVVTLAASGRLWVGHAPWLWLALPIVIVGAALLPRLVPTRVRVGADGLHLRWLRGSRFLSFGEIENVETYEDEASRKDSMKGLVLTLASGETLHLPVVRKRAETDDALPILRERIAEARDLWRRGEGVADAALVRRGARDTAQWVRALRGIGAFANADARTAPVLPEKLWRIVSDPAAPADARAGAAVALGQTADDEARAKLRAVASATAAPKLRIAIEAAASNEPDEALSAALSEIEAEAAAERKGRRA